MPFLGRTAKEVSRQEILYTVGMRGVHDGQMQVLKQWKNRKLCWNVC